MPILPDDTAAQVFDKVTVAAEQVLWRSLPAILAGQAPRRPNDIAGGSYFGGRRPEDGRIDWQQPAARVYDLVRAVAPPYPGAYTEIAGHRLVVARARRPLGGHAPETGGRTPGLHVIGEHIVGVCGDGEAVLIHELLDQGRAVTADALSTLIDESHARPHP